MSLLALAALAAASQTPGFCAYDLSVEVTGTLTSVSSAPAAPLDAIAVGDSVSLELSFGADVGCSVFPNAMGYVVTPECSRLTVGGMEVGIDTAIPDPCIWSEFFGPPPMFPIVSMTSDAPFLGGAVRVLLDMEDPMAEVGIGLFDIIDEDIIVSSVTAPGFTVSATLVDAAGMELATIDVTTLSGEPNLFATNFCIANPNSTGVAGSMAMLGSLSAADNDITLVARFLPADVFGFFFTSRTQDFFPNVAGSAGNLCLGGLIGRYVGPGQIQLTGSAGEMQLPIDLTNTPQPFGPVVAQAGETWYFSSWFRDVTPQGNSNFTDGLMVPLQ